MMEKTALYRPGAPTAQQMAERYARANPEHYVNATRFAVATTGIPKQIFRQLVDMHEDTFPPFIRKGGSRYVKASDLRKWLDGLVERPAAVRKSDRREAEPATA
jgi:hypothetical protein